MICKPQIQFNRMHRNNLCATTVIGQKQMPRPDSQREPGPVPAEGSPPPQLPLWKLWAPVSTRQSPKSHLLPPLLPKTNTQKVGVKVGLKIPFGYCMVPLT